MSTALFNTAGRELNFKFQLSGFTEALNMLP
jgi:invasion protein IalB